MLPSKQCSKFGWKVNTVYALLKKIFSGHPGKKHFSHPQTVAMFDTIPYFDTTQLIDRFDGTN